MENKAKFQDIEVTLNRATEEDIRDFLIRKSHNQGYYVPFTERSDIDTYAKKWRSFGNTYEIWHNNQLDALLVVYFNLENKEIYIPFVYTAGAQSGDELEYPLFNDIVRFRYPFTGVRLSCRVGDDWRIQFYSGLGFRQVSHTDKRIEFFLSFK